MENSFEIDGKLFADFRHKVDARGWYVQDYIDNRIGRDLRSGQELTDEQIKEIQSVRAVLSQDALELAGMIDKMTHYETQLTGILDKAMAQREEQALRSGEPAMQFGGVGQ